MNESILNDDSVFRYPVDVRFFEVDSLGVVFNMWYLGWCDEAMSAFMESIGYGYATLRAGGTDAVLRKAELGWLDSIERVDAPGQDRTLCAQVTITYVCVAIADRNTTPIPAGLREALGTDRI